MTAKKIILICTTVIISITCFAQENQSITQALEKKYGFACYHDTNGGWYSIKKDGKKGACDLQGNEVIPPIWDNIFFDETYYKVKKDNKVGIRDLYNKEIIPADKYDEIRYYQMEKYGYCEVEINNKVGVLSKDLKEVIPCKYDDVAVYSLKEQPFCIAAVNNKKGVYDINLQREIIPCKYDEIRAFELKDMDICRVETNGKCGLVNKNGKEIVVCQYDDMEENNLKRDNYCIVVKNGYYGIINKNGQEIISPIQYSYLEFGVFNKTIIAALVQKGSLVKRLFFDENYEVHDPEYQKKGKCGVVELKTGKEIIPCKYDDIKVSDENLYTFNVGGEKPTIIKGDPTAQGGEWGVIDSSNKVVIPAEYDTPIIFKDGVAQVSKNRTTSLLSHPYKGSSLAFANGITSNEVDGEIPQTNKSNKETFAFVFANENYTNFSGADYSINDGKIFAEYCKKTLGLPEHNVRYFEDATYGNLVSAIKKIEDIASVYEGEATIIVYYSGLGTIDAQTKERYILPSDAAPNSLGKTGYSIQKLIEQLDALTTKGTYVLLDAPFTGTDKKGQVLANNRGIRIAPKQLASSGSVLICFSNSDNENSYASSKYGHGLFTYGILKKLKDCKGNCSWKELLDSSSEWVKKESLQQYDKMQTPKYVIRESNNSIINKNF